MWGSYCAALYDHADQYGWDAEGFVVDEVETSGAVLKASRRSWPHTEALKANVVEGEIGRKGCDERATACIAQLMNAFVGRAGPRRLDRSYRPDGTAHRCYDPGEHAVPPLYGGNRGGARDIEAALVGHLDQTRALFPPTPQAPAQACVCRPFSRHIRSAHRPCFDSSWHDFRHKG